MTYAARQDMIDAFGEQEVILLTDRDGLGVINDVVLQRALDDADAEINPYLAPRYTLPLATVPRVLLTYACDIARKRLTGGEVTETEAIRNRYNDAIKFLDKVSTGKIGLGIDAAAQPAKPSNTVQFSDSSSKDWARGSRG